MLTYETWKEDFVSFFEKDETKGALQVLEWAYKHYEKEIVYACSFGIEGMVLLILISTSKTICKNCFFRYRCSF